jgi:hypothetical protein
MISVIENLRSQPGDSLAQMEKTSRGEKVSLIAIL